MDSIELRERVDETVDRAISSGRIVGSMMVIARDGDIIYRRAAGQLDREAGRAMPENAIFRLASVSKPMVAATALAMVERLLLGLDNAVSDHLPYFRPRLTDGTEARITIRNLLTHTSGLGYDYSADPEITTGLQDTDDSLEDVLTRVARQPLSFRPGTGWQYGISIDVLGAVIAKIHGSSLADAFRHYVAEPLGLVDTGFVVTDRGRLAVPYGDTEAGPVRMGDPFVLTDPEGRSLSFSPNRAFNRKAFQSGGAGMVGTADEILAFLEALRQRGGPILKPETVALAVQNQIGELPRDAKDAGQRFGFLGAVLVDPAAADSPQAVGTIRWGGVYGHDWFVDPANGLTVVSLTNTAVEGCLGSYPKEIRTAVYGD